MKKLFVLLLLSAIVAGTGYGQEGNNTGLSSATQSKETKIRLFVANVLREYPLSQLADLYKSSFQDVFGPEHLVEDVNSVMNYLDKELSSIERIASPYFEPCGLDGNFIRVNLNAIQDGIITKEELADCFIRSSMLINKSLTVSDWQKEWRERCNLISKMDLNLANFEEDSIYIENLIDKGHYAWVHSRVYHDTYKPHYRIIQRDIFFEEIFPKIIRKKR